jgi:shikimate dehydrogenase
MSSPAIAGLIGDPVAHSRSPAMHNAAFAHLGIDARYELWHTPATELPRRIASLRAPGVLGANVTLPHKEAVIPLLDALEPEAAQIGAVNTIYPRADGALVGANTDAPGLLADLREQAGFVPAGRQVVVLGASGAARAAVFALVNAGVARLVVANRTLQRAETLVADLRAATSQSSSVPSAGEAPADHLRALALDDPALAETLAACDLLINATSVGWNNEETPLPEPPLSPGALVYDMVYRQTRLLRESAARGAHTLDGLGMLLHQGALAFTRWTGQQPPLEIMRAAMGR